MDVQSLPIEDIEIGKRLRPAYPHHVDSLAKSIRECADADIGHDGLRVPVEVCLSDGGYTLIAGLHRLEAIASLDRTHIAGVVLDTGKLSARRLEVEENLVRHELTRLDEAMFVAVYREIFEVENGSVSAGRPSKKNMDNLSLFPEWASERLGRHSKTIQRALRIARGLRPDVVDMLRGTGWDENQKALIELGGVEVERQAEVIARLLDPESGYDTVRDAIKGGIGPTAKDKEAQWLKEAVTRISTGNKRMKKRLFGELLANPKDFQTMREVADAMGLRLELAPGWKGGPELDKTSKRREAIVQNAKVRVSSKTDE